MSHVGQVLFALHVCRIKAIEQHIKWRLFQSVDNDVGLSVLPRIAAVNEELTASKGHRRFWEKI